MHFAIVNNQRTPPSPNLSGTCPVCERDMIARCGSVRVHHWAHRGKRVCDNWWEPETEWHRNWKNHFAPDWQEVIGHDQHGEKHIADVRTPNGISIEFQYSHLRPEERAAREAFHPNLAWVVSGTRLTRDFPRFTKGKSDLFPTRFQGIFACYFPEEIFPKEWVSRRVPVFFDFREMEPTEPADFNRDLLWCLLPGRLSLQAIVVAVSRAVFVKWAKERTVIISTQAVFAQLAEPPPPPPRSSRNSDAAVLLAIQQMQRQQAWKRPRRRRF
jgi:competence protein CoiA